VTNGMNLERLNLSMEKDHPVELRQLEFPSLYSLQCSRRTEIDYVMTAFLGFVSFSERGN
jgi:hypothetical protein